MATDTYNLWCLIEGDKTMFGVTIPIDNYISHLRDRIKQMRSRYLEKFDSVDLILWQVCYF
jgi:hypothetical protein